MATEFNSHPGTPAVMKFSDVSFGKLVSDVSSAKQDILSSAKSYTDTKTENMSESGHTHVTTDITDASTTLAVKSHTHTSAEVTDLSTTLEATVEPFIRAYTAEQLATIEMNDGDEFIYFNLTTRELCKASKISGEVTTTKYGILTEITE